MPIYMIALLEKWTRLHGGNGYFTTVRVIARCNGSFFGWFGISAVLYFDKFILISGYFGAFVGSGDRN